jgi:hypothetical protein
MEANTRPENFIRALCAPEVTADHAAKLRLYGQFVGSWEAEAEAYLPDGTTRRHYWQIHFAWVLEGRAIQDVWITPPRQGPRVGQSQEWGPFTNQYGTTLRVYQPASDSWQVTWIDPASGYQAKLTGGQRGDEIFQEGTGSDGRGVRWIFSEMRADSFRWRAEFPNPANQSWQKVLDLRARRTT